MPHGIYSNIECEGKVNKRFKLLPHQQKTLDYFVKSEFRGLLLYHKLG